MALNNRIKKLEESLGENLDEEARKLAQFMVEVKLIPPEEMESAAASFAEQGMTIKKMPIDLAHKFGPWAGSVIAMRRYTFRVAQCHIKIIMAACY